MKIRRGEPSNMRQYEMQLSGLDGLIFKGPRRAEGLNSHMFKEDITNIFRASSRQTDGLFEVTSNNDRLTHRLLGNIKTRYASRSLDSTLRKLIEEIAKSLIWYGKVFYYLHDDEEKEETHVISCGTENLFNVAGYVVQYLPKRTKRNWDREDEELPRELRLLDSKKILRFRLSAEMRQKISAQNKVLMTLDKHNSSVALRFQPLASHENPNPKTDFEFARWRDIQDLALYKATRETGWNAREYGSQKRSDFFNCHRLVRFRRNQLFLRDHILRQLSHELTRVGRYYRKNFRVQISTTSALPSVSALNELEARLSREDVQFSEITDYYFHS